MDKKGYTTNLWKNKTLKYKCTEKQNKNNTN